MSDATSSPTPPASVPGSPALDRLRALLSAYRWPLLFIGGALLITGSLQLFMGRSILGPDGKLGGWEGNIWSSECSQRLADPYSFSHIAHGLLFYAGLWWATRHRLSLDSRFVMALVLEAGWEILENSPLIINRYREATMALGYEGDSIVNSLSDILMMVIGFVLARRLNPWMSVTLLAFMELGCAFWIRDNLTLNIIMLLHPIEAIKAWQTVGHPPLPM